MSHERWTAERVRALIGKQLPYLQANKYSPGPNWVWFGMHPRSLCPHWIRAHIESLQLIAAYASADPQPALIADVEQGLRAFCASHFTDGSLRWENCGENNWGNAWQSAWWTYRAVRCLHEIGNHLSKEIWSSLRRVAEFECDRFIGVRPPTGVRYDTKMEENAWDAPLLAWASFIFADHPNAAAWDKTARDWAFNAATTERDRTDMRLLEHQPVAKWYAGSTLHPDYTCENHGTFHPNYQACIMENAVTASAYELHGQPVPPSILHNMRETADVLAYFLAPDSTQLMITGNDWPTFHGLHSCLHLLAHYTGDPHLAAMAEANLTRCHHLLDASDNGHMFGSTCAANVNGWEFAFHTANATLLCDVMRIVPLSRVEPKLNPPEGSRIWHYVEVITDRDENRLASAAWRTLFGHPLFTFLPMADSTWAGWAPWTGLGRLEPGKWKLRPIVFTHEESIVGRHFTTAGVVHWVDEEGTILLRQNIKFETLPDGSAEFADTVVAVNEVYLERGEGICLSIANDLPNGKVRKVLDNSNRAHIIRALTGFADTIRLGKRAIIDNQVIIESDRELIYYSPGQRLKVDNFYLSTQFDRICTGRCDGFWMAGETVRSDKIRLACVRK